jgi:hypothetical protein
MTTSTPVTAFDHPTPSAHPAAGVSMPARVAAATTLVFGFALHLASTLILALPHNSNPVRWMTWVAEKPELADTSKTLDVLFVPFMVGSVVVYVMLGRLRSPHLSWVGGVLFAGGLTGLATIEGWEAFAYTLAVNQVLDPKTLGAAVGSSLSPAIAAAQLLFLIGVGVGLPLTVVALWRSRAVPRTAALLLLCFLVVDLMGYRMASHLIGLTGAAWIAITVLRAPRIESVPRRRQWPRWTDI